MDKCRNEHHSVPAVMIAIFQQAAESTQNVSFKYSVSESNCETIIAVFIGKISLSTVGNEEQAQKKGNEHDDQ